MLKHLALFCIALAEWVPPLSGCSLSGTERPFWTLNNGKVHMALCQEEGELFFRCCREWKRGCIVLPVQTSLQNLSEHFNSYTSGNEFDLFYTVTVFSCTAQKVIQIILFLYQHLYMYGSPSFSVC